MPSVLNQNFLENGTGPLWELCPAGLALVDEAGQVALNGAARDLLARVVGEGPQVQERWLRAAAVRLAAMETPCQVVNCPDDGCRLEIRAAWSEDQKGWILSLIPVPAGGGGGESDLAETVSTLSHELRTPLASMKSSLNLVLGGEAGSLNEDQQHFLGMTQRNIDRLERLVSDLLDVSRADAGHLKLRLEPHDLAELAERCVQQHGTVAADRGISLFLKPLPGPVPGLFDGDKVEQMLANLLGNALKFTPRGGTVEVAVSLSASRTRARLAVRDDGPGMDPEAARRALEPFQRSVTADSTQVPGSGLGLHITGKLAEMHGGRLGLETAPGEGTTAWVELPLDRS
jgi:signal transduction histidine kinase